MVLVDGDVHNGACGGPGREEQGRELDEMSPFAEQDLCLGVNYEEHLGLVSLTAIPASGEMDVLEPDNSGSATCTYRVSQP